MSALYKTFKAGRIGPYSQIKWPKRLGAWVAVDGPLELCRNGIHVARGEGELLEWLHDEVYEVEVRGESIEGDTKSCHESVRLVRRVTTLDDRALRLFAADCAERALSLADEPDPRSVEAIRVARLFAKGEASRDELAAAWAAARDAAWAAARDAASVAAEATGREWQAERLRWYIAGNEWTEGDA